MKNLQQNLLIVAGAQPVRLVRLPMVRPNLQRSAFRSSIKVVYQKAAAIQGYTNSIRTMDRQIAQMDARLTQLKGEDKTNADLVVTQRREINRLQATADGLTNQIAEYKSAVESLQGKLKEVLRRHSKAKCGHERAGRPARRVCPKAQRQREGTKRVVARYNELAAQVEKLQGAKQ